MEKIKVNMTPIEEVKTIHASQNDNATRKWAFDLYDENGKIDSSDIKEQMIFDSKVGGTEQILPENTSDPTTSPIIADIQYPDSLRSEQTFLYRESPTTVDGQAKITRIKGNTVVFNQLVQNGNFADTSIWATNNSSLTVSNNIGAFVASAYDGRIRNRTETNVKSNHKYLQLVTIRASTDNIPISIGIAENQIFASNYRNYTIGGTFQTISYLWNTNFGDAGLIYMDILNKQSSNFATIYVKDVMIIDLTQLNNSAITDAQSFRSYYNLPYYDYTQGKLLPFLGEELKTTGKNLFDKSAVSVGYVRSSDGTISASSGYRASDYIRVIPNVIYHITNTSFYGGNSGAFYDGNKQFVSGYTSTSGQTVLTIPDDAYYFRFTINYDSAERLDTVQFGFGSTIPTYEPYTTNTLSLPISTYFPTGMKDVPDNTNGGRIFDELTESKAINRVGDLILDTLDWETISSPSSHTFRAIVPNSLKVRGAWVLPNARLEEYLPDTWGNISGNSNGYYAIGISQPSGEHRIAIVDYDYSTVEGFVSHISGQYLYYELATPTEESITTASLVTSKGEAPLYYDDELIADCNETISSESGIFDAKIKLMDDNTIYSQKIQLHVERKP